MKITIKNILIILGIGAYCVSQGFASLQENEENLLYKGHLYLEEEEEEEGEKSLAEKSLDLLEDLLEGFNGSVEEFNGSGSDSDEEDLLTPREEGRSTDNKYECLQKLLKSVREQHNLLIENGKQAFEAAKIYGKVPESYGMCSPEKVFINAVKELEKYNIPLLEQEIKQVLYAKIKESDDNKEAHIYLAQRCVKQGEIAEAIVLYESFFEKFELCNQTLQKFLSQNDRREIKFKQNLMSDNLRYKKELIECYTKVGFLETVEENYQLLLKLFSFSVKGETYEENEEFYEHCNEKVYLKLTLDYADFILNVRENSARAEQLYREVAQKDQYVKGENKENAYEKLSKMHFSQFKTFFCQGKYEEAEKAFHKSLSANRWIVPEDLKPLSLFYQQWFKKDPSYQTGWRQDLYSLLTQPPFSIKIIRLIDDHLGKLESIGIDGFDETS